MKPFVPSKFAEIVFALVFIYFGYLHFKGASMMGGVVPDFFPGDGKIWVYIAGAAFILAGIAIIVDMQRTLACYLLAALLLIFVFTIHISHFSAEPSGLLKDTGLAMAAILIGNRGSK